MRILFPARVLRPCLFILAAMCVCLWSRASLASGYEDIEILRSDEGGVVFRYLVPEPQPIKIERGGELFDLININGCGLSNLPGRPQLPVRRVILAVPPEAQVSVEITEQQATELSGMNLAYAARAEYNQDSPVGYRVVAPRRGEAGNGYYPPEIVSLGSPTFLRNQRMVELEIFPIQYSAADKSARHHSKITVAVRFAGGTAGDVEGQRDLFEKIYQNAFLNYDQSRAWRSTADRPSLRKPAISYPLGYSDNWYKLIVRENGVYRIDRDMLIQAGIPVSSLDPRSLRILSGGGKVLPLDNSSPLLELSEIAISVWGEDDGAFDQDDYILFFGWSANDWDYGSAAEAVGYHTNPFTDDNVFWLTFDPSTAFPEPPKRMGSKDGSPLEPNPVIPAFFDSRIHLEQDNSLRKYPSGYVADYFNWYWMESTSARLFVSLPGALPEEGCLVRVKHTGSSPSIWVNGQPAEIVDTLSTVSLTVAESFDFHGGILDTLDVSFPGGTFLDWCQIEYSRRFECHDRQLWFESGDQVGVTQYEISDLHSSDLHVFDIADYFDVKRIEGVDTEGSSAAFQDTVKAGLKSRYLLLDGSKIKEPAGFFADEKSSWRETANRGDFLIVTHSDFYDQAQTLKAFRESFNGISVKVIKLQDVYDEFSGGLSDPVAIRDFLKFAFQNWERPAPAYVLLVGDGHYDFKDNLGTGAGNFVPPFAPTWEGDRSVSDENYVYFGRYGILDSDSSYGPLDRGLDMVISRWPVRTQDEMEVVLDKVIGYESGREFGTWRNLITLVADDEYTSGSSSEAFHTKDTEELSKLHVPPAFNLCKIYLMEYPFDAKGEKPEAEEAIINAFNSGTLIINYMGHGNPDVWSHERVFKRSEDIPRLNNKRELPLIYTASCSIGLFFNPFGEGMGEQFLRSEDKGSIATISATWLVYPDPNAALNYEVYDLLLNQNSLSIGEALFLAKLSRQPNSNDRQFILFGDPVMKLAAPRLEVGLTGLSPDTISALSLVRLEGEVRDDEDDLVVDFDGRARILAFDSERERTHLMPNGGKVDYDLPGLIMFKGDVEVTGGRFEAGFVVPRDISYGGNTGRISVYVEGQNQDGAGVRDSLVIRGSDTTVIDSLGPQITISFDEKETFDPGETVLPNSLLRLSLFDQHGINVTGEVGHGITLVIDEEFGNQIDLTGAFEYDLGSYQKGSAAYPLPDLPEGDHVLTIKAWDNANNSSMERVSVRVSRQAELELTDVMNYPNPFPDETSFYYRLSRDADRVEIKVFTLAGRLIHHIPFAPARGGYNFTATWNGEDQDGDKVANGVYIYKVTAEGMVNGERKVKEVYGKAVVVR